MRKVFLDDLPRGKRTSEFKIEIGTSFEDNKRDITITDRKCVQEECMDKQGRKSIANKKYYKYKCNRCGFNCGRYWSTQRKEYRDELWILESNILTNKQGCSICNGNNIVVENINSIYKTDKWMIPYIGEECAKTHTHGSGEKVKVICPDCKKIKKININKIYKKHSVQCSCGDGYSYGHKYIIAFLTQLKQEFIDNYTFDWCKFCNPFKQKEVTGEYDFVLKKEKLIVEVDGDFHRKDNDMNGQSKEESKFLDDEKDRLAKEHGYKVIRISDEDDVKQNILNSNLSILFDLNNINWNECEEFALSNRVKEACNYKNSNLNLTTTEIGKIMKISKPTIIKYLKQGTKLGWCQYNTKEEIEKRHKNTIAKLSKPIKIFNKQMNLIYMFVSVSECQRQSEKLLGIKFSVSKISSVCTGTRKTHKEYIFKYIEKEEYNNWLKQNQLLIHNESLGQAI